MRRRFGLWAKLIPSPFVEYLATLGPLGYLTRGPGTVGSVAGLGLYVVFFFGASPVFQLILCALFAWLSIGICGEAEVRLQKRDPGEIILDEFIAMPLVFLGVPMATLSMPWIPLFVGFILFRVFDIFKPIGIARLQNLPDGVGVVADDLAAALAACLCLHTLLWLGLPA